MRRGVVPTYDDVEHRGWRVDEEEDEEEGEEGEDEGEDGGLLEGEWVAVLAAERGRIKNVIQ